MYLIVGLGNPGNEYKYTRHNIGFETINKIAYDFKIDVNTKKHKGLLGRGIINGNDTILLKPTTYMNLSGESIISVINFYKIPLDNIIIIYDDITLDVGHIKIKKQGSAGGHNGIKNIIQHLKTDEFNRIKIGVGKKPPHMVLKDYVLTNFLSEEREDIIKGITLASDAASMFVNEKIIDIIMNEFNRRIKDE